MNAPRDRQKNKKEGFESWTRNSIEQLSNNLSELFNQTNSMYNTLIVMCRLLGINEDQIIEGKKDNTENHLFYTRLKNAEKNNRKIT